MIKINVFKNILLKNTSIMFIATLIGGGCNYLFQIFMGRTLGPNEYGIFGSLFAIFYIINMLTATIQTSSARFVSKFIGEGKPKKINYFTFGLLKRMLLIGVIIFLIIFFSSNFISSFLKITSIVPVIILAGIFLISTLVPINLGLIQGLQKFIVLGISNILNYSSKLIFGIILITIGFGVSGALGAVAIGSIIAFLFTFSMVKSYLNKDGLKKIDFKFKDIFLYSLPTLIAMFCFTVPANVDVIIAKHFFAQETAGLYTAVTVLGKIILFIPGAVVVVMFPNVSRYHAMKKNTSRLLHSSLFYTFILSGLLATFYWFFPYFVVKIPFGLDYIKIEPIVQIYGIAMLFFSLTIVIMQYSLAVNDFKYIGLLTIFTIIEIGLLYIFHNSMMQMANILAIVNILLFIIGYIYVHIRAKTIIKCPERV